MDHSIHQTHSSPFSNIGPSLSAAGKTFLTRTKQVFGKRLDNIPTGQEKKIKSGLNTIRLGVVSVVSGGIIMGIGAGVGALLLPAHGAGVAVLVGGLVLGGSMILGGFALIAKGHYDMNKAEIKKTETTLRIGRSSNNLVKPQLAELQNLPILKYVEPTMVENYCTTIGSIADLQTRIDHLQTILAEGDWEDPSLDEKLPEEQSEVYRIKEEKCDWDFIKEGQWDYTTPFIALAALADGKITEAQFVQVQTYFSLRLQFPKEEIKVIKPPGLADDHGEEWKKILREVFIQSPYGFENDEITGMTEEEIKQFFESLYPVPLGEQIFFTFKSPHQVNKKEDYRTVQVETVCAKIRYTPFRMFSYGQRGDKKILHSRMVAPLVFYQNAFKIFFPESYVILRPQIGLSPIDAQYDRRSVDGQPGQVDVLTPFPGVFVPEADRHPAPGCEGMLHDIYHAFLTAAVPNPIRNFFLEETEKMCRDQQYAKQKLKIDIEEWAIPQVLELWKGFVYDLEDLGGFCAKHFYGKERTPKKDLNLEESMSEFGQKEWNKGSRVKTKPEAEALGLFPTFIQTGPWNTSSGVGSKVSEH